MKVITAKAMRKLEEEANFKYGVSTLVMMENAGAEAARIIRRAYPDPNCQIGVLAGLGNNGGDGFVVARHLLNAGFAVRTYLFGSEKKLKGDALANWEILNKMSADVVVVSSKQRLEELTALLLTSNLIVDALLGTGVRGVAEGLLRSAIELVNSLEIDVVALDAPSGLSVDTGVIQGPVIKAQLTICMGLPKLGFFHPQALDYVGELEVADLGIPAYLLSDQDIPCQLLTAVNLPRLPRRKTDSHKKGCGRLLIIAGSPAYSGAAVLAAQGALNSGAGYVTLAVPEQITSVVNSHIVEAVTVALKSDANGLAQGNEDLLLGLAQEADAVVLGPGLGLAKSTRHLVKELIKKINQPLIVDADALNILAQEPRLLIERSFPTLLTPHQGEFARLLGSDNATVTAERFSLAMQFAIRHEVHLLLKGAVSLIVTKDGLLYLNQTGGTELATAGTGDVLSGLLGGVAAQTLDLLSAAQLACFWHGLSGQLASAELGLIRAQNVAEYLPQAYQILLDESEEGAAYAG